MVRYTVYFTGRVQGVGFRYTTRHIARHYAVAGYVKNEPDGRVLLLVEGEPEQLDGLVSAIEERMGQYIADSTVNQSKATGEFGEATRGALTIRR